MTIRSDPQFRNDICSRCNGDGIAIVIVGETPTEIECPTCDGAGYVLERLSRTHLMADGIVHTYEIMEATDASEYNALSDANKDAYRQIVSCGIVNLADGTALRGKMWNMFDSESTTRANIIELLGE
jgi:DnaJ-class molecular chaperone